MSFNVTLSPQWRWDWESMCGAGGLKVWNPERHDLGLCFQQLCLQIPVLVLLACSSAYYYARHIGHVSRGSIQLLSINFRSFMVLISALLPLLQVSIDLNKSEDPILYVSFFLCAVQGIAWISHFMYTLVLRKRLGLSPRGPVSVCVIWTLLFVLTVVSVRSHVLIYHLDHNQNYSAYLAYSFSVCQLIVQIGYALTLIPSEGSTIYLNFSDRYTQIGENQPLLGNAYIRFSEEGDPSYLGVAMENVTWLSKLLFYWVNPLMEKGVQGKLTSADDLYDLPFSLNCGTVSTKLDKALTGNVDKVRTRERLSVSLSNTGSSTPPPTSPDVSFVGVKKHNVSLLKALHCCFWVQFYSIGALKLIADCAGFLAPLLLNKLVGFIEDQSEDVKWGYLYAFFLMGSTLISTLCDSHFNFLMSMVGLRMRGALVTTIYRKTLTVSATVLNSAFSVGEIVNFMSTDTDRIVNSCPSFHAIWSIPFQLVVTLYLLYRQVGLAFLAGVAFTLILIPINKVIANKIGRLSTELMAQKDGRVKMVTEVLRGIKAIKLYVWEQHFVRIITRMRDKELKFLRARKYLDALCVYFWATTPVLISILTFGTYSLMGHKLTAATVFTGMALLNMLIGPLNAFPWVLNGLTEAWVSIKRIQRLLNLEDLDLEQFYNDSWTDSNSDIFISNATFTWGKELTAEEKSRLHQPKPSKGKGRGKNRPSALSSPNQTFLLSHINMSLRKGQFLGIMGPVGSGKSSLLSAILAELSMQQGEIFVSQLEYGFGFVAQQPWLQRGTIRDNILFGKAFEEARYKSVLFACGLAEDVYLLSDGDMTAVGEGGTTLSGGQKARVALARAVYQDKSVYLMDDVLSAVDVKVARHIFQHCIMGLLKNKTRVLCTHHVKYLVHADKIVVMEGGSIAKQGRPAEILTDFDDIIAIDLDWDDSAHSSTTSSFLDSIQTETTMKEDTDSILLEEYSETGTIRAGVYATYWKAIGHALSILILISVVLMQSSRNVSDWWLSYWVTNEEPLNLTLYDDGLSEGRFYIGAPPLPESYFMKIYLELVCFNTLFTLIRAFLFAYGGVVAALRLHKLLLKSVMKAKSTFFDVTPIGRLLNRFSSDTYTSDDSLPFILNIFLAQFAGLFGTIVVTVYGLPWICLVLFPLIPVYHWLQYNYRMTSRELKRISSVTLSPVYSHFNETLQGLSTIRAMRATQRFKRDNEDNVDANIKAQFASQAASRWLAMRLQFIGVAMITGVSFIAVIQHQYDVADPGLVGLAMSYALSITSGLSGVVNAFTETEREMVSVERIEQYIREIPSETANFIMDPPFGWPSQGVVTFNNVVLKYREHLAPSLKLVSFETRPSEKIGVVGRTGAGKSSLVSALFRMVELYSGSIQIDSVDIHRVSLQSLRSRLFCIPQEPFLFSGTLKENLDPLGEFRDNEIWDALSKVNLTETIKRLGGLDHAISGEGVNFSVGQKQLVCLARAVLHNAKVLCIDEATANVDRETDRQVQHTLRSAFRKSTVITIAHRVQTIMDCDRVLVMNDGQVEEFDHPDNLLADSNSLFYQLVNQE